MAECCLLVGWLVDCFKMNIKGNKGFKSNQCYFEGNISSSLVEEKSLKINGKQKQQR